MNDDTTCTTWEPTEKQRAVLASFQDKGYDCPIEEACEAAGVSRRAYYYWHDDPQFSQWWADQSNRHFRLELHRVHAATLRAATGADASGSTADRRLFYERFDRDYCPQARNRNEISGPGGGAIPLQIVMFGQRPSLEEAPGGGEADTAGRP